MNIKRATALALSLSLLLAALGDLLLQVGRCVRQDRL